MSENIQDLAKQLESEDPVDRRYALEDMCDLEDNQCIPYFIDSLKDSNTSVKEVAIDALINLKSKESLAHLINILKSEDFSYRNAAIEVLNSISYIDSKTVINSLSDPDPDILKFLLDIIICNITKIDFTKEEIESISLLLNHKNENVAGACSELLANARPNEIIQILETANVVKTGWIQYSVLHTLKENHLESFKTALDLITKKYKTQESELILKKARE